MYRFRLFCHNQGISRWIHTNGKALRRSSSIILRKSVGSLRCCEAEFAFFLSGFSFTNIHDSQDSKGRGRISLWLALSVWLVSYLFSTAKSLLTGRLRIVLVFVILTIAPLISKYLLGNTRVTMAILQKCLGSFS